MTYEYNVNIIIVCQYTYLFYHNYYVLYYNALLILMTQSLHSRKVNIYLCTYLST